MGVRALSRTEEVDAVVTAADCYAVEIMDMIDAVPQEDLAKVLSGVLLMFLTDVAEVAA